MPKTTPDTAAHLDGLMERLDQEMARAAVQYDGHRTGLALHHGHMDALAKRLEQKADQIRPALERLITKPGTPLDPRTAAKGLRYLRVMAKLGKARTARRLAHGATAPRGYGKPGAPLG